MRIFLAATQSGMSKEDRQIFLQEGKPLYILETFFNGPNKCKQALADVGVDNFLLDSGAFSFMSGAECSKKSIWEYAEKYSSFIQENNVKYYFELDVDTIFGIKFAEEIRRKLERQTGKQSIPVWHKSRGIDYWKRMVDEYKYIAIGGLVFHVKKQEWPLIHKMVDYAYKNGVRVHGLGFTKTKQLKDWNFYSVDSASFTKAGARGQQRYDFDGEKLVQRRIDGAGKRVNLSKLVLHNGIEWCKYQRYMDERKF